MMTEKERSSWLAVLDGLMVAQRHVCQATGMTPEELDRAMTQGRFPLPFGKADGEILWSLGDIARLEWGWV